MTEGEVCRYLDIKEVAQRLNVSHQLVYKEVHHPDPRRRLRALRMGTTLRVEERDLEDYVRRQHELFEEELMARGEN